MRGRDIGANEVVVRVVCVTLGEISRVQIRHFEADTYTVSTTASSILRTGPSRVHTSPPPPVLGPLVDASMLSALVDSQVM